MNKKTYMKPLVSVCAIEALTILADSTVTPPSPKPPVSSPDFRVDGGVSNGDNEDVWEQQGNNQKLTTRTQIDKLIRT